MVVNWNTTTPRRRKQFYVLKTRPDSDNREARTRSTVKIYIPRYHGSKYMITQHDPKICRVNTPVTPEYMMTQHNPKQLCVCRGEKYLSKQCCTCLDGIIVGGLCVIRKQIASAFADTVCEHQMQVVVACTMLTVGRERNNRDEEGIIHDYFNDFSVDENKLTLL